MSVVTNVPRLIERPMLPVRRSSDNEEAPPQAVAVYLRI